MQIGSKILQVSYLLSLVLILDQVSAQESEYGTDVLTPKVLSKQQGDKRPEDQASIPFFGRPLTIGGEFEIRPEVRRNLGLRSDDEDELLRVDQKFEIEAFYDAGRNVYLFAETKLKRQNDFEKGAEDSSVATIERGEMWAFLHFPTSGFGVQIGRQAFKDKREWWWDADLDAVRLRYDRGKWRAELSLAQELAGTSSQDPLDPEDEKVLRVIGNTEWRWADRQVLEFFWLHQSDQSGVVGEGVSVRPQDEDETDANLDWLGVRSRGTFKLDNLGRFYYWGDLAWVNGEEDIIDYDETVGGQRVFDDRERFSVSGMAFDIGATWRWETTVLGEINITASYAAGAGDKDLTDNKDDAFRQTGLQDNNAKFRGVDRFRYYGELFRPELSNMQIVTVSIGRTMMSGSSIELLFHDYRQMHAAPSIRDSQLDLQPLGVNRDLGTELDLVIGLEEWVHWELEIVAAAFRAGPAFGDAENETSFGATLKINLNF